MLKRLEMVGFKSFADKTAFDFPPGITAIVGPNGSGKSNIVDAVRWVLGEQSARSLRGGEMTDVIFNGSASRRGLGLAEVTMTFDNARRVLSTELDEVQITRRVYRGGEGEYLINGQICRLKDIRDLFLGSGAGTDAYCIIEQGRVDGLLQASTKERRTIFEEAAGISRFKSRKVESLRKLERVEQNAARLKDVLEVEQKQLRTVRFQAAKARRYQEYTDRLKSLRLVLGLREYHALEQQRTSAEAELEELRATLQIEVAQTDSSERELALLEAELTTLETTLKEQESALSLARQQIAGELARRLNLEEQAANLDDEEQTLQVSLAEMAEKVALLAGNVEQARVEVRAVEETATEQRDVVGQLQAESQRGESRLAELQAEGTAAQDEHMESMRLSARLQNDAVGYHARLEQLYRERNRLQHRREQAAETLASLDVELGHLRGAEGQILQRLNRTRQTQADLRAERDRLRALADETSRAVSDLRAERSGLLSRIEVLEDLERSHEGLGSGVREVFALIEQPDPGLWSTVRGLVADVLTVRREFAPLIDLALGERAEHFLVASREQLNRALNQRKQPFSSRVTFLPMPEPGEAEPEPDIASVSITPRSDLLGWLPHLPGLVALAERVVRCDEPGLAHLPAHLLGRTLIVRDLAAARAIGRELTGCRYVTLRGEVLESDGTLTVGMHHAETGILSRKSELRDLREQLTRLDMRLDDMGRDLLSLRDQAEGLHDRAEELEGEVSIQSDQVADLRTRIIHQEEHRNTLHSEVEVGGSELTGLQQEIAALEVALAEARQQALRAEEQVHHLHQSRREAEREARALEGRQAALREELVTARVSLAQVEERVNRLSERCQELEETLEQREQDRAATRLNLVRCRDRQQESELARLACGNALASAYSAKEDAERLLAHHGAVRTALRTRQRELSDQVNSSRSTWRTTREQAHAREMAVLEVRGKMHTLAERLREDYALDLADLYRRALSDAPDVFDPSRPVVAPLEEQGAPLEPTQEIEELRKKLAQLGSVNLEALTELSDLEQRTQALQTQFDDLMSAQNALQEIITRINTDSRRLFLDTFGTIRTHFQELFRKLFGGGQADMILEDESAVLECGIEIMARPPGKELRGISLMSGGEKTMTAVALLLAIFRSKPSPFCILDEVDAALDEANVSRFTAVLRDYLDRSQFILITHSKRTMACADVLYGVTMQESGISRRVGVRFEDWPDESQHRAA
jgi:chromosome segregation protein